MSPLKGANRSAGHVLHIYYQHLVEAVKKSLYTFMSGCLQLFSLFKRKCLIKPV